MDKFTLTMLSIGLGVVLATLAVERHMDHRVDVAIQQMVELSKQQTKK